MSAIKTASSFVAARIAKFILQITVQKKQPFLFERNANLNKQKIESMCAYKRKSWKEKIIFFQ
jgi:hypothetical protein